MTRAEIEQEFLVLPEAERSALLQDVAAGEAGRLQALKQAVEAEMARWFEGPAEPMTEADWQHILSGKRTEAEFDRPLGLGVPPEWTGKTLRELRDS
ncbi:MAG: hypothetical protein SX243_12945 [Acidobacteriota bacterium]|nr:hypothetical protein [Acidobacteriota bacterium]